jgi:hypothetical protein
LFAPFPIARTKERRRKPTQLRAVVEARARTLLNLLKIHMKTRTTLTPLDTHMIVEMLIRRNVMLLLLMMKRKRKRERERKRKRRRERKKRTL